MRVKLIMINNKRILVVVPARGGSKGIFKKNLALISQIPLIAYSIEAAKNSQLVDRVIVSSDDDEIIKVNLVGVGSTNSLSIVRGELGTVAAAHTVGAAVTVVKGDYRINEGKLYFSEAPFGLSLIHISEPTRQEASSYAVFCLK